MFREENPGRFSNFIGQVGQKAKETFGYTDSGLAPDQELFGMNPRRAYWSAALGDLANVAGGQPFQNRGMEVNQQQTQYLEALKQQKMMEDYKNNLLQVQYLAAMKPRAGNSSEFERLSMIPPDQLTPDQRARLDKLTAPSTGSQTTIQMAPDIKALLPVAIEKYETANQAAGNIGRYQAMGELSQHLGRTGTGKEALVSIESALNTVGLGEIAGIINAFTKAGVEQGVLSGDYGIAELYKALANEDVGKLAKDYKPFSNTDLQFVMTLLPTLKISDPAARKVMLDRMIAEEQRKIDSYNSINSMLEGNNIRGLGPININQGIDLSPVRQRTEAGLPTGTPLNEIPATLSDEEKLRLIRERNGL